MKRTASIAIGLGLMIGGLLMMTAGVLLLALAPAQYEATGRLMVVQGPPGGGANAPEPSSLQREIERMKSTLVLRTAITNLQLDQLWAKQQHHETPLTLDETERQLKERMDVRQARSTSLIEVSLSAYDAVEAALLANAVAEAICSSHPLGTGKTVIVEKAVAPNRSRREKHPLAVILFLGGTLLMVAGYVFLRPHLAGSPPGLRT